MPLPPDAIELYEAAERGDVDLLTVEIGRLHGALNLALNGRRAAEDQLATARGLMADLQEQLEMSEETLSGWMLEALRSLSIALARDQST